MDIDIKLDDDKKIQMGVLLFKTGKKIHLDEGEVNELQAIIDHAKKEGQLGREIATDGLEFICPHCNGRRLECCEDGPYSSEILNIDEEGDFDYGKIDASGQVERYQCLTCGYTLEFDSPEFGKNPVTDNEEVVEWIKERA